ncbi:MULTISPECIES: 4Fe-4S dicluster domain-containing protein [Mycobacterium]|uniref:4Fe-4S dicluster domain-containing protein n=1 Tax=Mycobacterium TaxID=1763 RepID=UPI001EF07D21|nr:MULTISPECIES: 4Fe-4S dicluster domain-containing protein [Mycobacterium]
MAFVIAAPCVADYSCLEACPVGCIRPTPDEPEFDRAEQLYIDSRSCIDCAACVEACPVDAVFDAERIPDRWRHYVGVNRDYFGRGENG